MSTSLANFEYHRAGIGLLPSPGQGQEGSALYVELPSSNKPLRSCTCDESRQKTCSHLRALKRGVTLFKQLSEGRTWDQVFRQTLWRDLARLCFDGAPLACADIRVASLQSENGTVIRITNPQGQEVARYHDQSPARIRFLERCGKTPDSDEFIDRAALLDRLYLFQITPEEKQVNEHGVRTSRQSWEESFWYRLAYHCVREFTDDEDGRGSFYPAVDLTTGDVVLTFRFGPEEPGPDDYNPNLKGNNPPVVKIVLPRGQVAKVLEFLKERFPEHEHLAISPLPLQSIYRVTQDTELDIEEARPIIRKMQMKGLPRYFRSPDFKKMRHGDLVYLRELGVLAELEASGQERKFRAPLLMRLQRGNIGSFEEEHPATDTSGGEKVLAEPLRGLQIWKEYDFVEISTEALERSWFYLSVKYGFGDQAISLEDIIKARRQGLPYLETPRGWIDLNSQLFDNLERLVEQHKTRERSASRKGLKLSASELLRFQAVAEKPVKVSGRSQRAEVVRQLLELKPNDGLQPLEGLTSVLRPYQEIGVNWLQFLYENRLAGLLCDDMGLGKTHQGMALMVALREHHGVDGKFLVVCPTSVISHWRNKIRDFAPGLTGFVYHGPERDFAEAVRVADVIITSYGILRNDQMELGEITFALAILDEIQHIKNRDTLGYEAARTLDAEVKIGLTGTPIENTLDDLKALFDLLLPGYLGSDQHFSDRYTRVSQEDPAFSPRLDELRRLISPFVLRRLKESVLDELPEKIEDTRTCDLSEDQLNLYRQSINTRGAELVNRIKHSDEPLPYIHIFALLNYLKQICDHPALALKDPDNASRYRSGKWDLFSEILGECLDAGLKVVVFTQYLGMIELMQRHLKRLKVDHVKLTGASTDRGEIIDRFNLDPSCRVFLGSLKAGGTGIDLVGGSVVIHYDRWWNAAREDQATDRVHRIGQKRAVQVFKLVTEGTLEEKIAAIIDRKRELMESVVQEDDPHLAKIFSREELLGLLQQI